MVIEIIFIFLIFMGILIVYDFDYVWFYAISISMFIDSFMLLMIHSLYYIHHYYHLYPHNPRIY